MLSHRPLDLRKPVVTHYWQEKDPRMARILLWMETVEDWMLDDHHDVSAALRSLAIDIQRSNKSFVKELSQDWLTVLAYLSSSRALRLVDWFEHSNSSTSGALDLVQTARAMKHDEYSLILLDRLQAMRTLNLLGKIFSSKRLENVISLLKRVNI
jgi:hypothetical protein